jgi:hypothetical protein
MKFHCAQRCRAGGVVSSAGSILYTKMIRAFGRIRGDKEGFLHALRRSHQAGQGATVEFPPAGEVGANEAYTYKGILPASQAGERESHSEPGLSQIPILGDRGVIESN